MTGRRGKHGLPTLTGVNLCCFSLGDAFCVAASIADTVLISTSLGVLTTCVIGGGGFIGQAVCVALLERGRNVVIVGRENTAPAELAARVRYFRNEPGLNEAVLRQALSLADEVIDLAYATVPGTSFQDPINDILVNLPEAVRLFELASEFALRKFVWVSSGGTVYGRTRAERIAESHPTQPLSPYGITKLAIEKYAHMYFESRALPIVCVRPSNAFGPGQRVYAGQGFVATAIASVLDAREITLFGEHGTVRDYLHVADMARGIVAALEHGQAGEVYNIGSEVGLSNRQVLDALAPLAAAAGLALRVRAAAPRPFDVPTNVLDCGRLRTVSGWRPGRTFTEGLADTWAWYVAHYRAAAPPIA